jgi:transposase, IS30 family
MPAAAPGWPGASWSCAGHRGRSRAWLALAYPDDPQMQVSHETIYLSLFVQARGALRKELTRCLRSGRARRRPHGLTVMNGQGKIRGMVNISERPAEAADRAVPGHWESQCSCQVAGVSAGGSGSW